MMWETKSNLRARIREQEMAIASIRDVNMSLTRNHDSCLADIAKLEQKNSDDRETHARLQKLLQEQIDFWKTTALTLLDKEAIAASGVPTFRQAAPPPASEELPEPSIPSVEDLRVQDNDEVPGGIPRAATLRNPRAFTRHTTLQHTIEHNRREIANGVREAKEKVEAALRKVDAEARARAAKIASQEQTA